MKDYISFIENSIEEYEYELNYFTSLLEKSSTDKEKYSIVLSINKLQNKYFKNIKNTVQAYRIERLKARGRVNRKRL